MVARLILFEQCNLQSYWHISLRIVFSMTVRRELKAVQSVEVLRKMSCLVIIRPASFISY